jgi:hypothetical protein
MRLSQKTINIKKPQSLLPVKTGNIKTDNSIILIRLFTPPPAPPQKGRGVVFYPA